MADVTVDGHRLRLTNLDKDLYRGFTKGEVIDYYARIAPVMLPHLEGHPLTLRRFPDGVDTDGFFEKRAPSHRPDWVGTVSVPSTRFGTIDYTVADSPATLVWLANLAALELHALLSRAPDFDTPTGVVFDLDPGSPADIVDTAEIAIRLRDRLDGVGLTSFAKVSGGKGIHVWVPLHTPTSFEITKELARTVARVMTSDDPERVTASMTKAERRGKIFIDWSQNDDSKTTVAVYSLRAGPEPRVSAPVTWEEVGAAVETGDPGLLRFTPSDVLERVARDGDLFAEALDTQQTVPGT